MVTDNYWEQIDLFSSVEFREKQMKADAVVDGREVFLFYEDNNMWFMERNGA